MISSLISDIAAYRNNNQGKYPVRVKMSKATHDLLAEKMSEWAIKKAPRGDASRISGVPIEMDETVEKWELEG